MSSVAPQSQSADVKKVGFEFVNILSNLFVAGRVPLLPFWNFALRTIAFLLPLAFYFTKDYKSFGGLAFNLLIVIALLRPLAELFPEFGILRTALGLRRSLGILAAMAALTHGLGFLYLADTLNFKFLTNANYWVWDGKFLYGIIGMFAAAPLLITSNNLSVKFFGKFWRWIQKLMYVMFYAACVHVALLGKLMDPLFFGGLVLTARVLAARGVSLRVLRFLSFLNANPIKTAVQDISETVWQCVVCGYIYDENVGDPDGGIAPGTRFEDIPDSWRCPVCGVGKVQFTQIIRQKTVATSNTSANAIASVSVGNPPEAATYEPEMLAMQAKMVTGTVDDIAPLRPLRFEQLLNRIFFLPAQLAHRPLEEHGVEINLETVIGPRAAHPLRLKVPFFVSHMSFGSLSREAKIALSRGAAAVGTASCSGEGGALPEELAANKDRYIFEYASGHFGINTNEMQNAAAIEIKIGQAAKAGMGGHLPGAKVTAEIAAIRGVPMGEMVVSPAAHADIHTPEDLKKKIAELRKMSGCKPIGVKIAAAHIEEDIAFALAGQPDFITVDCRGGATGAAPAHIKENVCVPAPYAITRARATLDAAGATDVSLIVAGGFRTSADIAKALALGADAVGLSTVAMIGIGCRQFRVCHRGTCPMGIATQSAELRARFDSERAAVSLANLFRAYRSELADFARIVGKADIHALAVADLMTTDRNISENTPVRHA